MSTDQEAKNGHKNGSKNGHKNGECSPKPEAKVDRKHQVHSASFTCSPTGNRELAVIRANKSESLPPKSPLFKIFNQISQNNKSANNSDENLGNSSSSSSTNLRASNSNIGSPGAKSNDEKDHFAFDRQSNELTAPSSILKQPNKPAAKQRSLEKTIEFSTSVTSISDSNQQLEIHIRDSDEEKDVLFDENGEPYGQDDGDLEENSTLSWRKQIFSSIHSSTRGLELSSCNESKGATKSVTFDSSGDLFKFGTRKRTREELRELWRKAINQQIVLIKMEKENLLLQGDYRSFDSEVLIQKF